MREEPVKKVLVTGSCGFIGKNLVQALSRRDNIDVLRFDSRDDISSLSELLREAEIIYHLAGVNRPERVEDFEKGNTDLTKTIVSTLRDLNRKPTIVLSSSTQARLDNPYGISKKNAEDALIEYHRETGAPVFIYRLTNVFGKWCKPNYNSAVATFCYNISHGLDISISDPQNEMKLIYIDDVIASFMDVLDGGISSDSLFNHVSPVYKIILADLANRIYAFRDIRGTLIVPDFSDMFDQRLYATYLSYLEKDDFSYQLEMKSDERGNLSELIKSRQFGQMFVSTTQPGITRGNHYHDTKIEKFMVLKGEAIIRFRHVLNGEVISYAVSGKKLEIVDIPPGYTHSIENVSDDEMTVLFWADQVFDPEAPDTYFKEV